MSETYAHFVLERIEKLISARGTLTGRTGNGMGQTGNGLEPWVFALLLLLCIGAIIVLAVVWLVPPVPTGPYLG